MRSASKAVIFAGAIMILVPILMYETYIYRSAHSSIIESSSQISEMEKTSFNQQWNTYEGAQGGNNIKALLQKLIANCNTNKEEGQRLVDVYCSRPTEASEPIIIPITVDNASEAITQLSELRNQIEARHTYYVSLEYSTKSALVNRITIKYEKDDEGPMELPDEN